MIGFLGLFISGNGLGFVFSSNLELCLTLPFELGRWYFNPSTDGPLDNTGSVSDLHCKSLLNEGALALLVI